MMEVKEENKNMEPAVTDVQAQLLYGDSDRYGIYQLKDNPKLEQFRFMGMRSLAKRKTAEDNFDPVKPENYSLVYVGGLSELQRRSQEETLEAVYEKFNIDHPADYKSYSLSVSDIVVLHENGENSAHFVDSFGFTALPDFMRGLEGVKERGIEKPGQKSYPAVYPHTAGYAAEHGEWENYLASRKLNINCKEAVESAIRENFDGMHLGHDAVKPVLEEYGAERVSYILSATLQQKSWDGRFSQDNKEWASETFIPENIVHGTDMNYGLAVNSHPAVLDGFASLFRKEVMEMEKEMSAGQEKAQDASNQQAEPQGNVVSAFKAKTDEMFHEISKMGPAEIEAAVKRHVRTRLEEYGIAAEIVDAAIAGSRCRGLEKEGSDLDVVVELSTKEREDDLFGIFNEEKLHIGDVAVDINPITEQRTGTLETYLESVRKAGEREKAGESRKQTAGRESLKGRLSRKKEIAAGRIHENQENGKKKHREM